MTIFELRNAIDAYRASLRDKKKGMVVFSEEGPVGMAMIELLYRGLVEVEGRLSAAERRIKSLEEEDRIGIRE